LLRPTEVPAAPPRAPLITRNFFVRLILVAPPRAHEREMEKIDATPHLNFERKDTRAWTHAGKAPNNSFVAGRTSWHAAWHVHGAHCGPSRTSIPPRSIRSLPHGIDQAPPGARSGSSTTAPGSTAGATGWRLLRIPSPSPLRRYSTSHRYRSSSPRPPSSFWRRSRSSRSTTMCESISRSSPTSARRSPSGSSSTTRAGFVTIPRSSISPACASRIASGGGTPST
jgi:hypothetical protein